MMLYKLLPSWPLQQSSSDESSSTWPLDSSPRFRAACWPPAEATTEAADQFLVAGSPHTSIEPSPQEQKTLRLVRKPYPTWTSCFSFCSAGFFFCSIDARPLLNLSFLDGFAVQFIVEFCLCVEDRRNRGKPVYFPNLLRVQLTLPP